jgi:hypothetical protein
MVVVLVNRLGQLMDVLSLCGYSDDAEDSEEERNDLHENDKRPGRFLGRTTR